MVGRVVTVDLAAVTVGIVVAMLITVVWVESCGLIGDTPILRTMRLHTILSRITPRPTTRHAITPFPPMREVLPGLRTG